jgi:hypothetical protein
MSTILTEYPLPIDAEPSNCHSILGGIRVSVRDDLDFFPRSVDHTNKGTFLH